MWCSKYFMNCESEMVLSYNWATISLLHKTKNTFFFLFFWLLPKNVELKQNRWVWKGRGREIGEWHWERGWKLSFKGLSFHYIITYSKHHLQLLLHSDIVYPSTTLASVTLPVRSRTFWRLLSGEKNWGGFSLGRSLDNRPTDIASSKR